MRRHCHGAGRYGAGQSEVETGKSSISALNKLREVVVDYPFYCERPRALDVMPRIPPVYTSVDFPYRVTLPTPRLPARPKRPPSEKLFVTIKL